ncbi:ATP-binding protein [Pectinatus frisingensis]|uniref:ATP-binding protein n=1 Tax=Pectinatus frisingensis TaxID=865 RepID=UPI0018C5AD27|nr:ATP-binding protein [Pectinatus frisingensis]
MIKEGDDDIVKPLEEKKKNGLYPYLTGFLLIILITLICWHVEAGNLVNITMLYLLPVLLTAFWWGRWPSYFTTICTVLVYDFLFVPPVFSFSVAGIEYIWTFIIFLFVGFIAGGQTEKLRNKIWLAEKQSMEIRSLYEFSKEMAALVDLKKIIEKFADTASQVLGNGVVIFLPDDENKIKIAAKAGLGTTKEFFNEYGTALWAFEHGQPAGKSTAVLPASKFFFLPLKVNNKVVGVLGIEVVENITLEQKQLIKAWATMAAIAVERVRLTEESNKLVLLAASERLGTALFNSISHELKTPLAAIMGAISVLTEKNIVVSEKIVKNLYDSIKNGAQRMERIINNLLDTARLESGTMKIKTDWCDIEDIVGTALQRLNEILQNRKIVLNMAKELPLIRGDCVLLEQVLVNLIDNANKYSPADKIIAVSTDMSETAVLVSVTDYGDDISEPDMKNIFTKFYRGSHAKTVSGTGLGLSICKAIIEAHHGKIWVTNLPAGGKKFMFTLPREIKNEQSEGIDNR